MIEKARALAGEAYRAPEPVPDFMQALSYDEFRTIRFNPDKSLWRAEGREGFEVMLVAAGRMFQHSVTIHEVADGRATAVPFRKDDFTYGDSELEKRVPANLGHAGFKLTYPLNRGGVQDQFLVFAGASYFRGVGKGDAFGLSARGIAVDTALMSGEEFPPFTEYWLVRPDRNSRQMQFYALLDGKRLTGAYRFTVSPGEQTRLDVEAVLFTREAIERLGLAPLTSMFYYGENTHRPRGNWRPEVHDSDGLLIHNGTGEWLWRPLLNPKSLEVHSFSVQNAYGFGLLQRDRLFPAYQDPEADYERRPNGWVDLGDGFEKGRIMLVQIPTGDETNDNIVAFWTPEGPVKAGAGLKFAYSVSFGRTGPESGLGQTVNSYVGRGDVIGGGESENAYRFVVDFAGGSFPQEAAVAANVSPLGATEIIDSYVEFVSESNLWRMSVLARPTEPEAALGLRAFLEAEGKALTETWTYHLPADNTIRQAED